MSRPTSSQVLQTYLSKYEMDLSQISSTEFDLLSPTVSSSDFSSNASSPDLELDANENGNFLMSSQSSNNSTTLRLVNPTTLTDSQSQPFTFSQEPASSIKSEEEGKEVVDINEILEILEPNTGSGPNFDSQLRTERQNFITTQDTQCWEGKYKFSCAIKEFAPNQKFSETRSMLYCQPFTNVQIQFNCDFNMIKQCVEIPLQIKCFLLFKDTLEAVSICEKHRIEMLEKMDESDSQGLEKLNHVLHCHALSTKHKPVYTTANDGNLYLTTPLGKPALGVHSVCKLFSFECLNSCHNTVHNKSRGIIAVFELLEGLEVVGRSSFDVRVCACPIRDFHFDEKKSTEGTVDKLSKKKSSSVKKAASKSNKKKRGHQQNIKIGEQSSQEATKKKPRLEACSFSTTSDISTNCIEGLSNLFLAENSSQEYNKSARVDELSCKAEAILKMSGSSIPLLNYLAYRLKNEIESVYDVINKPHRVLKNKDNKGKADETADSGTDQTLEDN